MCHLVAEGGVVLLGSAFLAANAANRAVHRDDLRGGQTLALVVHAVDVLWIDTDPGLSGRRAGSWGGGGGTWVYSRVSLPLLCSSSMNRWPMVALHCRC